MDRSGLGQDGVEEHALLLALYLCPVQSFAGHSLANRWLEQHCVRLRSYH